MINLEEIRKKETKIVVLGNYPIIQSILDFDYLSGRSPSILYLIASGRRFARFFWGKQEILLPMYKTIQDVPTDLRGQKAFFLNLLSPRRVLTSTEEILDSCPNILGGVIFAENVPEKHAISLYHKAKQLKKFLIGPASVGLLLPGHLKLGAIGGVDYRQLIASHLFTPGDVAVFSASGGMTGELLRIVTQQGRRISFALSFGGDRFPITSPREAFLEAERDPKTKTIIYFGELGGADEYELATLLKEKKVTKEVICYIAGSIAELFSEPPQFGHAKAMAKSDRETASAKRIALKNAGAKVAETFSEFITLIKNCQGKEITDEKNYEPILREFQNRQPGLITTSISGDKDGKATLLGEDLLSFVDSRSFAGVTISMFLGQKKVSRELETFVDFILRLLVDHGPYVSGAVNTIITARAGRDLVSSLASGLLTIGPRFGGAINQAAENWLTGVVSGTLPGDFVEEFALKKQYISGIGHRKYRIDLPDPRVVAVLKFVEKYPKKRFTTFAKSVEKITTEKKGSLILNVDGAIAAVLLDILSEKEGFSDAKLQELVETEFFNALFVLSRSVGFISHFLDQKRLDEGLFRLPENLVAEAEIPE